MMLILMRHAEATSEFGIDDHSRNLSGTGQRAALDLAVGSQHKISLQHSL